MWQKFGPRIVHAIVFGASAIVAAQASGKITPVFPTEALPVVAVIMQVLGQLLPGYQFPSNKDQTS